MGKTVFEWNPEIDAAEQADVIALLIDNNYKPVTGTNAGSNGGDTLFIKNLGDTIDDLRNLAKVLQTAGLEIGVGYYNVVIHPKR